MDNELIEAGSDLPYLPKSVLEDEINARRIAEQMYRRHGYYMALYHCTTLAIHCHKRNRENRIEMGDIAFWFRIRTKIQRMRAI